MAKALLRWGADYDVVAKAATADGLPLQGSDPRSTAEKKFDEAHAPATPQDYVLNWNGLVPPDVSESELPKFDGELRGVLSSMNLSKEFGSSIAEQALRDAQAYRQMDDKGKASWDAQQTELLASAVGQAMCRRPWVTRKPFCRSPRMRTRRPSPGLKSEACSAALKSSRDCTSRPSECLSGSTWQRSGARNEGGTEAPHLKFASIPCCARIWHQIEASGRRSLHPTRSVGRVHRRMARSRRTASPSGVPGRRQVRL